MVRGCQLALQDRTVPDMIRETTQEVGPVACLPEPEALGVRVVVTHRRVPIGCAVKVKVHKFLKIRAHDLISVDEENLLQVHWEEHIEEEDLVRPDDPLFLGLRAKPGRPLVRNELVLEAVLGSEVRDEFL